MTKIIFPDKSEPKNKIKYGIGDWVVLSQGESKYLCVIAQVDNGKVACICIDHDANRMFSPIDYKPSPYTDLSEDVQLCIFGRYKVRKVVIEIKVMETNG